MATINSSYDPETEDDKERIGHHSPAEEELHNFRRDMEDSGITPDDEEKMEANARAGADQDEAEQRDLAKQEEAASSDDDETETQNPSQSAKTSTPDELRSAEGVGQNEASFYNANGDNQPGRASRLRGSLKKLSNHKLLVGSAVGGAVVPIALILLLVLAVGPYKVVDFAEDVSAYQFARVTRQMSDNTEAITSEEMGIDVSDDTLFSKISAAYNKATEPVGDLWKQMDKYRPNQILENYDQSGKLKFNYKDTKIPGHQQLTSVSIDDVDYDVTRGAARNLIPGYNFVSGANVSRNFSSDLISSLKADDIGPITRAQVASQIRQKLNISLSAWVIGRFLPPKETPGETPAQQSDDAATHADAQEEQLSFEYGNGTDTPVAVSGVDDGLDKAASEVQDDENKLVSTPSSLTQLAESPNQQLSLFTEQELSKEVSATTVDSASGAVSSILGAIDPYYKIGVPVCMIYDGSMEKSGGTIDAQTNQNERTGVLVQTEADQEKDGSNVNGEAVGAADWKVGDITQSNAIKRASGLPVNTAGYASTEETPTGQYTYSLASFLPGPIATLASAIGSKCPVITNMWVGLGIGAVNLGGQAVLDFFTGGGATAGEAATEAAADAAVDETVPSIANQIASKIISSGTFAKDFVVQAGKQIALTAGLTIIAKSLVASQAGLTHSTLSVGPTYDNDADAGTNNYANQIEQQQFYGAPMSDGSLGQDNSANQKQLALQQSQESSYDRYLALDNPNSLLSHLGLMASTYMNRSFFSSLLSLGTNILNPIKSLGSVFGSLLKGTSFAATPITSANTYYGNVQFGFTQQEQQLMASSSYQPLPNQSTLDQSNEETAISNKYGVCFTESIGTMLQNGDVQRDQSGNVIANQGLCSPDNLGPDNTDPSSPCGPQGCGDLVFRWRVAQGYLNTLDQLNSEETVGSSS